MDILAKGVPVKNTVEMCMGEVMVAKGDLQVSRDQENGKKHQ